MVLESESAEQNSLEAEKNSFFSFFEQFEDTFLPPYEKRNLTSFLQKLEETSQSKVIKSTLVHEELKTFLSDFSVYTPEQSLSKTRIGDIKNITALILVALATNQ